VDKLTLLALYKRL
jgi:hypothetical protein